MPTPLAATRLVPPDSLMDAVDEATRAELIAAGKLRERTRRRSTGRAPTRSSPASCKGPRRRRPHRRHLSRHRRPPRRDGAAGAESGSEAEGAAEVRSEGEEVEDSLGDQAKDVGIGFAKDLLTTADGRRTLRTVFGTLLGKK